MTEVREKKRKLILVGVTFGLCITIMLSGTFAWQSISQKALNEAMGEMTNPGGRLHDDFNGRNKDIYVENFTKQGENGMPIIVRIRLFEHMEIGENAGNASVRDGVEILTKDASGSLSKLDDVTTWHLHKYGEETITEENPHTYWTWKLGGQTTYMPTFNMNKDSKEPDTNGTFAGKDGKAYGDYVDYTLEKNKEKTGDEVYDNDNNDKEDDGTYTIEDVTHQVKQTYNAEVIGIAEWAAKEDSQKLGNYWVYDEDGWAYWANPLGPEEATGLLLDEIILGSINGKWYYGIYVECQMVTADEIANVDYAKEYNRGFYHEHDDSKHTDSGITDGCPSATVQLLLEKIIAATRYTANSETLTSLEITDDEYTTISISEDVTTKQEEEESEPVDEESTELEETDKDADSEDGTESEDIGEGIEDENPNDSDTSDENMSDDGDAGDDKNDSGVVESDKTGDATTENGTNSSDNVVEDTVTDKETTESEKTETDTTVDVPDSTKLPEPTDTESQETDTELTGIAEE